MAKYHGILGLVIAGLMIVPSSQGLLATPSVAGIVYSQIEGSEDLVRQCRDSLGRSDLYEVIDQAGSTGSNYHVVVMKGIYHQFVRVAWEAQIPRTYEGVAASLSYVSDSGVPWEWGTTSEALLTGKCGVEVGPTQGYDFDLEVHFMGQDITVSNMEGWSVSHTVSVGGDLGFSVNPVELASFHVSASYTGTFEKYGEITVTTKGYHKTFAQSYSGGLGTAGLATKQIYREGPPEDVQEVVDLMRIDWDLRDEKRMIADCLMYAESLEVTRPCGQTPL